MPFGESEYCLHILQELNDELSNWTLKSIFPWVNEGEYEENRKKSIYSAFDFVWDFVQTELPCPSKVDALYIAYAQELNVPVITDDQDMTQLAKAFDVEVMPTLQLLGVMYDCTHVNLKTVKGIIDYWRAVDDCPANLHKDTKRFFPSL